MELHRQEIRRLVEAGESHEYISHRLQLYPGRRGLSARSVRWFCAEHGIRARTLLSHDALDRVIQSQVSAVGHTYGRTQRQKTEYACCSQSCPVQSQLLRRKASLDQNEKPVMHGVTHVLAVDGYSRKIVGFVTMPRKNPITLFQPVLQQHGLWDQVRMDHGTEFVLVITVQQFSSPLRVRQARHPALQSTSRQNHRAERLWSEVNCRINYPVKDILVSMEEVIYMTDDLNKFCVSWVAIKVISPAVGRFIRSWNSHRIPGRNGAIPSVLDRMSDHATRLQPASIPSVDDAVALHENIGGIYHLSVWG